MRATKTTAGDILTVLLPNGQGAERSIKQLAELENLNALGHYLVASPHASEPDSFAVRRPGAAEPRGLLAEMADLTLAPSLIRFVVISDGPDEEYWNSVDQLAQWTLQNHPRRDEHPVRVINLIGTGANEHRMFRPNTTNVFVAPLDQVDPGSLPAKLADQEGAPAAWLTTLAIVNLAGLWKGSNGSGPLDVRDPVSTVPMTVVVRSFARIVFGPSALDESVRLLIGRLEEHHPTPTGCTRHPDPAAALDAVLHDLYHRHGNHISARPYRRPPQPSRQPIGIFDALAAVFAWMSDWFVRRAQDALDTVTRNARSRVEQLAQRVTFGEDSAIKVVIRAEGRDAEEIDLDPDQMPAIGRLESIAEAIHGTPVPDDDGWREAMQAVLDTSIEKLDGGVGKPDPAETQVLGQPGLIARDPTRWMPTPARGQRMRSSPREVWLAAAAEQLTALLSDRAGLAVPDATQIVVDVPTEAHVEKGSWVVGQCHYLVSPAQGYEPHVLIHPRLDQPIDALATLAHELIHAALPDKGHGAEFRTAATQIGLELTELEANEAVGTTPGEGFRELADGLFEDLGAFPPDISPLLEQIHLGLADSARDLWQDVITTTLRLRTAMAENAEHKPPAAESAQAEERPGFFRQVLGLGRRILKLLAVLLAIAAVVAVPILAAFALPLVLAWVGGWLLTAFFATWALGIATFRHKYRLREWQERDLLMHHLLFLVGEVVRLRRMVVRIEALSRFVGVLVHHPFGYGVVGDRPPLPASPGDLPRSIAVAELDVPEDPTEALEAVGARTLERGWLASTQQQINDAYTHAQERHRRLIQDSAPVPDAAWSSEGLEYILGVDAQEGMRRRFVDRVAAAIETFEGGDFYDVFLTLGDSDPRDDEGQNPVERFLLNIGPEPNDGSIPREVFKQATYKLENSRTVIFSKRPAPNETLGAEWVTLDVRLLDKAESHVEIFARIDLGGPAPAEAITGGPIQMDAESPEIPGSPEEAFD